MGCCVKSFCGKIKVFISTITLLFIIISCNQSENRTFPLKNNVSSDNNSLHKIEQITESDDNEDTITQTNQPASGNEPQKNITDAPQLEAVKNPPKSGYLSITGIKKNKDSSININEEIDLTVEYTFNGEGHPIIDWTNNGGEFIGRLTQRSVRWKAPNIAGKYQICAIFTVGGTEIKTSTYISVINLTLGDNLFHSYYEIIDGKKYNWVSPLIHGKEVTTNGFDTMCSTCHGADGKGNNNINLSCFKCHNFPHPKDFIKVHVNTNIIDIAKNCLTLEGCHNNRKGRVLTNICNNVDCHRQ